MGMMQRLLVSGRVQQVGYRNWAVKHARDLGVTGWVRNLRDGRVEIMAEGDDEAMIAFLQSCEQGPPLAAVAHVDAFEAEGERHVKGFTKRFTA